MVGDEFSSVGDSRLSNWPVHTHFCRGGLWRVEAESRVIGNIIIGKLNNFYKARRHVFSGCPSTNLEKFSPVIFAAAAAETCSCRPLLRYALHSIINNGILIISRNSSLWLSDRCRGRSERQGCYLCMMQCRYMYLFATAAIPTGTLRGTTCSYM